MKELFPGTDLRKKAATMKRISLFRAISGSLPCLPVDVFEDVMHQFLRNEHFEGFVATSCGRTVNSSLADSLFL